MKIKRVLILLGVLLIAALAVLFHYRYHPAIYQKMSWLYGKEIAIVKSENLEGTEIAACEFSNGSMVYDTSSGVTVVDAKKQYDMICLSPKMQKDGDYLLLYDSAGTTARVFCDNKPLYEVNTDHIIYKATVNECGYLTIISKEMGYQGMVGVYNDEGKAVYRAYFGEKYLLDADVLGEGKRLAVCVCDPTAEELSSEILFYRLNRKEPDASYSKENARYSAIRFFDNGSVLAIGEQEATAIGTDGKKKWEYSYEGAGLQRFSFGGSDSAVLVLLRKGQKVVLLEENGTHRDYDYSGSDIKQAVCNRSVVLFATAREVYALNRQGYFLAKRRLVQDVERLFLSDKGKEAMFLYDSGYDLVKVK